MNNDRSDVIRANLRLLDDQDDLGLKWREQIERGWLQAQRGELVDGNVVFDRLEERIQVRGA